MVDKTQLLSLVAEGVLSASSGAEALANLHPVRVLMTSHVAKVASYSVLIIAAGYTTGVLFEKVFPNLHKFRRNVLGIRRRRRRNTVEPSVDTKAINENITSETEVKAPVASKEEIVPVFELPTWSNIWATAAMIAQPLRKRLHM
jgi:hypothetical protein